MTLRILLVTDVEGWAFDNIARNMVANLGERYRFTICHMAEIGAEPWRLITDHLLDGDHDLVHFFWRDDLRGIMHPQHIHRAAHEAGRTVEQVIAALLHPGITASIYDHLHLSPEAMAERQGCLAFAHGYTVSSPILADIYQQIPGIAPPDAMIPDGVRTDFFTPGPGAATGVAGPGGALRIGWVGNSRWGDHSHDDAKGLHTILKPALARLEAEGVAIEPHFADIQERRRSRDEMASYYHEIDVLVCASLIEGTPNPVLEAMASGVAVVSTDVGIVRAVLGDQQAMMILPERSIDAMANALRRLADDRALLAALKAENRKSIKVWDWAETTKGWEGFWNLARHRHQNARLGFLRRAMLIESCRSLVPSAQPSDPGEGAIPIWHPGFRQRFRQRAVDWVYARPRVLRIVNRLRGRKE